MRILHFQFYFYNYGFNCLLSTSERAIFWWAKPHLVLLERKRCRMVYINNHFFFLSWFICMCSHFSNKSTIILPRKTGFELRSSMKTSRRLNYPWKYVAKALRTRSQSSSIITAQIWCLPCLPWRENTYIGQSCCCFLLHLCISQKCVCAVLKDGWCG